MERFDIRIKKGKEEFDFEVRDYLHHEGEKCKFEVFKDHTLVVSFNPDPHENLTVCKNPGNLDKQLVHLIADKLERYT
ncbi:hypothetical protein [Mucilaginibacter sp.]|jgi:hypothetical protein|uniref:hypothetical protein n=1 Tax=Mucilaginibacter sp. TaxID=1882438 RepID=UPI003569A0F9